MPIARTKKGEVPHKVVAVITSQKDHVSTSGKNSDISISEIRDDMPSKTTVTCRHGNKSLGSLARHLSAAHDMTVDQYRAQHGADALINPPGLKPGRKPKAKLSEKPDSVKGKTPNLLACASGIELVELDRLARDGFTRLDKMIQDALLGRSDEARTTFAVAYEFSRRCVKNPDEAAALPRWNEATVQAGTNDYYRPLKCLTIDVLSPDLTSTLTQWAAIYRDADGRKLDAAGFADELKRRGRRPWYDSLPKTPRRNHGTPKEETPSTVEPQAAQPLSAEQARELLKSEGFTDPSKPAEIMDAKTAAALLADQGAQLEPDRMSLENARKHFSPPQALILWRADMLPSIKKMLAQMEGFVRILDLDSEEVKKIVDKVDNDR